MKTTVKEFLSLFENPEGQKTRIVVKPKDNDAFENGYGESKKMNPYYSDSGAVLGYTVYEGLLDGMPEEYACKAVMSIENADPNDGGFVTVYISDCDTSETERKNVLATAINDYATLSVTDAQQVGTKLEKYGFLKGLLSAWDMHISVEEADLIVINHNKNGKEVCRWERS